jgi:nucleoside-diphosphate-sugar epimerase
MKDMCNDTLREYRLVNVEGTVNLAKQAAAAGVRRFVYISSIKVNGDSTTGRGPFKYDDTPSPSGPYAVSKFEAEERLKEICSITGMEFVIIRPPLIYGYGVKANFSAMFSLAKRNLPLPLGGINNRRSLLALDNLVAMIEVCTDHVNAKNQIFLVSDDNDISTSELLRAMIKSYGKNPYLLAVPASWIVMLGNIFGKKDLVDRLCGDLHIDIEHTKLLLDWEPHVLIDDVLREVH